MRGGGALVGSAGIRVVVVALVECGAREGAPTYIVTRRPEGSHLGGAWEVPGGGVEAGESPEEALHRELSEELGIAVDGLKTLTFSYHRYPRHEVLLLFYAARARLGETPRPLAADALELLTLDEVLQLPMPPANEPFKSHLRLLAQTGGLVLERDEPESRESHESRESRESN